LGKLDIITAEAGAALEQTHRPLLPECPPGRLSAIKRQLLPFASLYNQMSQVQIKTDRTPTFSDA